MISVLCSTYGRTHLLSEMIECFLRQTYTGAELVILNDCERQRLTFDHPRVRIINRTVRFPVYGDKRNYLLTLATYDLVSLWDDDDIYLPNFLSDMMTLLPRFLGGKAAKPALCWNERGGRSLQLGCPGYMNAMLADRHLLLDLGGFARQQFNEDVPLLHKLVKGKHLCGPGKEPQTCPQFIFRHSSGLLHMTDVPNETSTTVFAADVERRMADGKEPTGSITLHPHWKCDYQDRANQSWERFGAPYANGNQPHDHEAGTVGQELQRVRA